MADSLGGALSHSRHVMDRGLTHRAKLEYQVATDFVENISEAYKNIRNGFLDNLDLQNKVTAIYLGQGNLMSIIRREVKARDQARKEVREGLKWAAGKALGVFDSWKGENPDQRELLSKRYWEENKKTYLEQAEDALNPRPWIPVTGESFGARVEFWIALFETWERKGISTD